MSKLQANKNFWLGLKKPLFVMAPLANVTDSVFRKLIAKYGKPDILWTEFVSADGLISAGQKKLLVDLVYSEKERPIVAQLFTGHPEAMYKAAQIVKKLGFDGLDINMGCPDRAVEKQGGGAAHIKNPEQALEVLKAAREGWSGSTRVEISHLAPVTIKTRIGYNKVDLNWIKILLEQKLPALTIHLRTRKEMSDVPAHWKLMPEIIKLRNEISPSTSIIGNGDVTDIEHGSLLIKKTGCDGVMIGRGIFGKPWLFENVAKIGKDSKLVPTNPQEKSVKERLKILVEHATSFEKTFKNIKNFAVMKKHFKAYVSGWDGAKELRMQLMETENAAEVKKVINNYLKIATIS